jgi:hypothetical protein
MKRPQICAVVFAVLVSVMMTVTGAGAIDPGQGSSHIVLMNAGLDPGSDTASVVPVLLDQMGDEEPLPGFTLNEFGSRHLSADDWTVGDGFIGSMVAYSASEMAAVALLEWTGGDAADGQTNAAYLGTAQPSAELYFPDANITPSFYSILAVQNTSQDPVEITMTYTRNDGTQTAVIVDTIPGSGQYAYDLSSSGDPRVPDLRTTVGSIEWKGAVHVRSTNPLDDPVLTGAATRHWRQGWSAAYQAFTSGSSDLYFPVITRRINSKGWFQYTSVQLYNAADTATTIDLTFRDKGGNAVNIPGCVYSFDVGGKEWFSFTTHENWPGLWITTPCLDFGTQFDGSLHVHATGDMLGVANNLRVQRDMVGTYNAAFGGTDELLLPAVFKKGSGSTWQLFSNILMMNLDPVNTTVVAIQWLDRGGNVLGTWNDPVDELLYPLSPIALNTKWGGHNHDPSDYDFLGDQFEGAIRVTSSGGIPIVAVVDTIWGGNTGGASYNAENR